MQTVSWPTSVAILTSRTEGEKSFTTSRSFTDSILALYRPAPSKTRDCVRLYALFEDFFSPHTILSFLATIFLTFRYFIFVPCFRLRLFWWFWLSDNGRCIQGFCLFRRCLFWMFLVFVVVNFVFAFRYFICIPCFRLRLFWWFLLSDNGGFSFIGFSKQILDLIQNWPGSQRLLLFIIQIHMARFPHENGNSRSLMIHDFYLPNLPLYLILQTHSRIFPPGSHLCLFPAFRDYINPALPICKAELSTRLASQLL